MLNLVVGWLQGDFSLPNLRDFMRIETFKIQTPAVAKKKSPREQGIQFELEEVIRLMDRLAGYESVVFLNPRTGTEITKDNIERFLSKDGGLDYKILIVTPTERGAKNVAGRIRNILKNGDY
jgi:hypothetical protein